MVPPPVRELDLLAGRAQRGDASALDGIYRMMYPRVTGLCRHMLGSSEAAEDAAAEVFLRLQSSIASFDPSQSFERWLLRVTANYCMDRLRRRRLERRLFLEPAAELPEQGALTPLASLLLKEQRAGLEHAIAGLAQEHRLPLVLRYYGDLSYEEIAGALQIAPSQVAGRLFRAKQILRKKLQKENA